MTHGSVVRSALIAALIPVLAYYAGDIVIWGGMLPLWHWGLPAVGFTAATVAAIAAKSLSPSQGARMLGALETLARYLVAYLLVIYGMNKLLPGQWFRLKEKMASH